jgi:transposase
MGKGAKAEQVVREIHRQTCRRFSAEEKVRIVLEGLRGEQSVAELCRRESLAPNLYYRWSKEFLEAGKKRLLGETIVPFARRSRDRRIRRRPKRSDRS